jgi:UDPglucose 6-dehydrogenase
VILTQWKQYAGLDYAAIYQKMKKPAFIFDGRGIVDAPALHKIGFNVTQIGIAPLSQFDQ